MKKQVKISSLNLLPSNPVDSDLLVIVSNGRTYNIHYKDFFSNLKLLINTKENNLGLPRKNKMVLTSDVLGNRSWEDPGIISLPVLNADMINTDTTNFNKNLSGADTNMQKALETLDKFFNVYVVGSIIERDLLNPKSNDICVVTNDGTSWIYDNTWILLQRAAPKVSTVSSLVEMDLLDARTGDVCNVTQEAKSFVYGDNSWVALLSSSGSGSIDDSIVSTNTTWSSNKISNRELDGGSF